MVTSKIFNHSTGEILELPALKASEMVRASRGEWSFSAPPPRGWECEVPLYKTAQPIKPPLLGRVAADPPWESCSDDSVWQYADVPLAEGIEVSTTNWPHPSFRPINESARRVHAFFTSHTRSRMTQTPWQNGRVRLDDGLSFSEIALTTRPQPPQPQRANVRR